MSGMGLSTPKLLFYKTQQMKINNEIFLDYLHCKHKAYLALRGERGEMSDYGLLQSKLQQDYKVMAPAAFTRYNEQFLNVQNACLTCSDLKNGPLFILDVTLEHDSIAFHFYALKQVPGKSLLGSFHYLPILFHEDGTIHKQQELLLSLGSLALEHIQGVYSNIGLIVGGKELRSRTIHLKKYRSNIQQNINELLAISNNITVPRLILNKQCSICHYEKRCLDQAKKEDNLSLLTGIGEKDINKFKRKGIFTINQLSYTFRPRRINKRIKPPKLPYYFALQSLAMREQKVYVFQRPNIAFAQTKVFVDMEGNANGSSIYLIGLLLVENDKQTAFTFWADTAAAEKEIFSKFVKLLSDLDNIHLFYYGSYESRVIKRLLPLVSSNAVKDIFLNRSINVLSMIYSHIYFPTYSNKLKDIGTYLGCTWSDSASSGLQSIRWLLI